MIEDKEGFLQPYIDTKTCIGCRKCEKTCPIITPIKIPTDFETQAFAAINKDEEVRMRSSSGGMFHALAKWTIEKGGVVFGARFNEQWEVVHDYTETLDGIEPFMRSKYVQSSIGETFKQAKQFLNQGRQVLFVGTPCQIGGLKAYLKKEYDNLLAVDFICHGVPSPKVWRVYLKETLHGDTLLDFNFRDKKDGWNSNQCIIAVTTTTTTTRARLMENPFFRGFRKEIYLRKSCYKCNFRTYHRISDFSIADYWGVHEKCPEMFDNKGTSIVFIHTTKAKIVFNDLQSKFKTKGQTKENAVYGNQGIDIENPVWSPIKRKLFYMTLKSSSFHNAIDKVDMCFDIEDWLRKQPKRVLRKLKKIYR